MKHLFNLSLLLVVAMLFPATANADNYFDMPDTIVTPGSTISYPIYLHNDQIISGFQFSFYYPEGFQVTRVLKGDYYMEGSSLSYNNFDSEGYVLALAVNIETGFVMEDAGFGKVATIKLKVPENAAGTYTIHLEGAKIMDEHNNYILPHDVYRTITVRGNIKCSSLTLDKTAVRIKENETFQLAATVLPEDAFNQTLNWTSSNPSVATVDVNGLVTAVGLGSATITAMTTDGSNLSASCQVTVVSESATNGLTISDAEVLHGETITIPVAMVNDQTILAFQTDIFLPEGFTIVTDEDDEYAVTPSGRLTSDHVMMTQNVSNGAVRVMCYTPNALPIEGNEGDLFYITVQVPNDAAGDYTIYLRNTRLTTTDYTELRAPDAGAVLTVKTYIPGDVNDSRTVNVADIVATAMFIMEMDPSPFIFDAADMNGDGEVTVTDVMLIARMILYPETMNAPRHAPAIGSNNDCMSGEVFTTGKTRKVSIMLDNEMDYSAFQLDLTLPHGLTASNFQLTDRAGNHALDVNTLASGKTRVLCYTPAIEAISGNEGAVLTFDVTANSPVDDDITVDGIELVTTACQMVRLDAFTIGVNGATAVNEVMAGKTIARVDYYNVAGQRLAQPESGVTLVVTTYTDGTRTTTKLHR